MESGFLKKNLLKMYSLALYRFFLVILGFPLFAFAFVKYTLQYKGKFSRNKDEAARRLRDAGEYSRLETEIRGQLERKNSFFNKAVSGDKFDAELKKIVKERFDELTDLEVSGSAAYSESRTSFISFFCGLFDNKVFLACSVICVLMYVFVLVFANPYVKHIFERLVMMFFVIFGVTILVFTILHFSPMDPAKNILGMYAVPEQVEEFNRVYGLDRPYHEQLLDTFKNILTFNLGKSFVGSEDVLGAIMRRFPVTLTVTFWSLLIAVAIAIPAGIFSSIKQYSVFDYVFMLFALLGLSIPNFWLGYMLVLNFSINSHWLNAVYDVNNWTTLIMPCIVLGTGLSASVARMTRSSMLEVIKSDYIVTARAKGLSQPKIILRHVLGNAMIPIVTVVGLQFGGMLGGAAVTEKVFNISGIGSYIVDKQFIPDIPIVLAGTVYVAVIVSVVNLFVDILYAFLDPRIKSKIKSY
ncbi:MAG: ABC transporter permease [Clostridiales bacterium]|jgi:peptide/nickel transport system permease protein|nr:ABC transporter permease [Clostridiales bacterium]